MLMLAFGLGVLVALLAAARAFAAASVDTIKALLAWVVALAGLSVAVLLVLSGRESAALGGLMLAGPLIVRLWKARSGQRPPARPARRAAMSRAEALAVLGLADPVSEAEVRAAWVRLMRVAHPDGGGSDWLASRVNQAKDVLLQDP